MAASTPVSRKVSIFIDSDGAERAYAGLEKRQEKLTEAITKGQKAGKDMTKELEQLGQVNGKMQTIADKLSGKIAPSLTDVKRQAEKLHRELADMSKDAPEYAAKFEAYKEVSARFKEMREQMNTTRKELEKPVKDGGMMAMLKGSALGTLAGNAASWAVEKIGSVISSSISGSAKLSDELTAIEKAADLSSEKVQMLNSAFGKMKTRTSTGDLRSIAVGLGQIGEAVTPENVANIDKIVVALGDEFGGGADEITKALGVLRNNLSDIKTNNYGDDVLKLGNAMNVLGATGLASADVITDITTRISGIGSTMKLTTGQMLGFAATMQETGIEVERGSTGFTRILQSMTTHTADFAKVAGMSFQSFARLVDTDIMAAFMKVAKGSQEASKSNVEFGRILKEIDADGAGASEVLAKMGANSEMLTKKIGVANEALTNSSSITDEFNKRNNNLAGTLDKIGKRMTSLWMSSGIPAAITDVAVAFGKLIGAVEDTDTALNSFNAQAAALKHLKTDVEPAITTIEELCQKAIRLGGESKLTKEEQEKLKTAVQGVATAIPSAVIEVDKYGNALGVSTTKAKEFIRQQQLLVSFQQKDALAENHKNIQRALDNYNNLVTQGTGNDVKERLMKQEKWVLKEHAKDSKEYIEWLQKVEKAGEDHATKLKAAWIKIVDAKNVSRAIFGVAPMDATGKVVQPKTVTEESKTNSTTTYTDPDADKKDKQRQKEIEREGKKLETILQKMQDFKEKVKAADDELEAAKISDDEQELQRVRAKYTKLIAEAEGYEKHSKAFVQKFGDDFVTAAELAAMELEEVMLVMDKQAEKRRKKETETFDKLIKDSVDKLVERKKDLDQLRLQNTLPGSREEYEEKMRQLQEFYEKKRELAKGDAEMQAALNKQQAQDEALLQRQRIEAIANKVIAYLEVAKQAFDIFNSAWTQQENNELARVRATNDKKKKSLDDRLSKGLISEGAYRKEVTKMEEQAQKKEAEIKKKQFVRNKIASIIEATINTAKAVTANLGNPIMAAIVGALGLAQITLIASQKVPEYAKGGRLKGRRHSQGGIPLFDRYSGALMAEAEEDEVILSRDTVANNPEAVDALLNASMNAGGRRVRREEMFPDMVPVNTREMASTVLLNNAANYSGGRAYASASAAQAERDDKLTAQLDRLNTNLEKGIQGRFVYRDFEKMQKEMQLIRDNSRFG